jgi:hypothetical protein
MGVENGRNSLLGGVAVRRAAGPSDQRIHLIRTSFHRWVELKYSPIAPSLWWFVRISLIVVRHRGPLALAQGP